MTNPVTEPASVSDPQPVLSSNPAPAAGGNDAAPVAAPDEDYSKEYEPLVSLSEVETKTGEEDEEITFKIRAKLFRFSKELNEWKERGTGEVRILRHKKNDKMRLLMRREKTLKICLNHYVNPEVELTENVGSDRSWVWPGVDYADGERDESLFAIRFRDSTNAKEFKQAYDDARDHMSKVSGSKTDTKEEEDKATEAKEDDKPAPETTDAPKATEEGTA